MNDKRKIVISLLFIFVLSFINCDPDDKDPITFYVVAVGGGFTGTYNVNAKDPISFSVSSDDLVNNSVYYKQELTDVDFLEIDATTDGNASSIQIKIYRDTKRVKIKTEDDIDDGVEKSIQLDYEYGDEEETSSD